MAIKDYLESAGKGLIIAFMIMLISAAVYLAMGREEQANRLAEIGYYFLVGGVILLLVTLRGEEAGSEEEEKEKITSLFTRGNINKQYVFVGIAILFVGILLLITTYSLQKDLGVYPGKPTLPIEHNLNPETMKKISLIGNLLLTIGSGLTGLFGFTIFFLINTIVSFMFKNTVILSLALFIALLYIIDKKNLYVLSVIPLVYSTLIFSPDNVLTSIGWGGLGFLLFFSIYASLPLTLLLVFLKNNSNAPNTPKAAQSSKSPHRERLVQTMFVIAVILVVFSTIYFPHKKTSGGIVSLDTIFNIKNCKTYDLGGEGVMWSWQRPLYTIFACNLSGKTIEEKILFFDYYLHLAGFLLLALASGLFIKKTVGNTFSQGVTMLLSLFYWTPFFLYAGFQTNLFALPVGLYLMYMMQTVVENGSLKNMVLLGLSSLFLGLWHPWTLAYFSGAAILLIVVEMVRKKQLSLLKTTITPLLPGWIAHLFVSIKAGTSGVASVASSLYKAQDFFWSIKYFVWGTALRGDLYFPALITIILLMTGTTTLYRKKWIVYSTIPAFLALLTTNGKLYIRFMVDSPIPLLIGSTLLDGNGLEKKIATLIIMLSTFLTWAYYIYYAPLTPHSLPS